MVGVDFYKWEDLVRVHSFRTNLILGNGASIAVDNCFQYARLLEAARSSGRITDALERLFGELQTEDFELVLNMLWHAERINVVLEIEDTKTTQAYADIRNALVETVRNRHVEYTRVERHLAYMAGFMKRFDRIISLNYDLIVYWTLLSGNELFGKDTFRDGFRNDPETDSLTFDPDWEDNDNGNTFVFYPHGNLILAGSFAGPDYKLRRRTSNEHLLDAVLDAWLSGEVSPLFVSEGTSRQKLNAINRSGYLSEVYHSVLPNLEGATAIFGWSIAENDEHILRQVLRPGNVEQIAYFVHKGNRSSTEVYNECLRVQGRIHAMKSNCKVYFVEATEPGVWLNPPLVGAI